MRQSKRNKMENKDLITVLEAIAKLSSQVAKLSERPAPKTVRATRSEEIDKLSTALAKAQGEYTIAGRTKENPFFKSKYADLTERVKASRPALSKYGLSVIQPTFQNEDGQNILETIMQHTSGQWVAGTMRIIPSKADVQSLGSYMSSIKKYSYSSVTGVVSADADDDDGELAVHQQRKDFEKGVKLNHKYNPGEQSYTSITKEQLEELRYELASHTDLAEEILEKMKIQSLSDMPKNKFMIAVRRVREIVRARDGK